MADMATPLNLTHSAASGTNGTHAPPLNRLGQPHNGANVFSNGVRPVNAPGPSDQDPNGVPCKGPSRPQVQQELQDTIAERSRILTNNVSMVKPRTLRTKMTSHQKEGLKWMYAMEKTDRYGGGILADDMGLGKTALVIALILRTKIEKQDRQDPKDDSDEESEESGSQGSGEPSEMRPESPSIMDKPKPNGGTLIVCPLSLIAHWEGEIIKHVREPQGANLSHTRHHGMQRTEEPKKLAAQTEVVITTYDVVRAEAKDKGALFHVSWERIILDEAHEVRNPETIGLKAVTSLEAKHRWCVTGTPLHNSLLDLHALYKFLGWAPFNDKEIWEDWFGVHEMGDPLLWTDLKNASMLRRMKSEFTNSSKFYLPVKKEIILKVEMDMEEREAYDAVAEYSQTIPVQPDAQEEDRKKIKKKKMYCVLLLRQITNHPSLLKEEIEIDQELDFGKVSNVDPECEVVYDSNQECVEQEDQKQQKMKIQADWNGTKQDLQTKINVNDQVFQPERPSSKMKTLFKKLKEVLAQEDKAVIVSQWTKMLDRIGAYLRKEGITSEVIQGGMNSKEREAVVNRFNSSSHASNKVLLLSLKAGGVGLSLVGGNHLFMYDLHWNPQMEKQACDRIHRLGQKKPVFIYKFTVKDTIEEEICERQKEKLCLAENVLDLPSTRTIRTLASLGDENYITEVLRKEAGRSRKRKASEQSAGDIKRPCSSNSTKDGPGGFV